MTTSEAAWSPVQLGRTIRAIRTRSGFSVSELARRSGLSQSFLSQVEVGQSDISVGRLIRVAQALGVRLTDLLERPGQVGGQVVSAADRIELPTPSQGLRLWLLAPGLDSSRIYATGTLDAGAIAEPAYRSPGSEAFVSLVDGAVRIDLAGREPVTLGPGDSVVYPSGEFERMVSLHDGPSVFYWVQTARSAPGA